MAPRVHSIEMNPEHHAQAKALLAVQTNVTLHLGRSQDVLPSLMPTIARPALYYLDAHWGGTAVLDEIDIIAAGDPAPVLVIHDCQVPGRPDLKFDSYDGQPICYEWLAPHLRRLFRPWRHWYNRRAVGHQVGVMFVAPED
jgi:hypothetical protein